MPKRTIEEMREQRLRDLQEYKKILSALVGLSSNERDQLILEREALLNLELPFKIDSVSLMEAYEKSYHPKEGWNTKAQVLNSGFSEEEAWQRNSFLNAMYKHHILPIYSQIGNQLVEVPAEDFHLEAVYQAIKSRILDSDLKESMKAKWCSKLNSLRDYNLEGFAREVAVRKEPPVSDVIDFFLLSGFFEYLEDQFLETGSKEDFQILIAIRLAFYVDVPIRGLAQIKFEDIQNLKENWYLISAEKYSRTQGKFLKKSLRFRFPSLYFELLKEGFRGSLDVIFPFSEKGFYKRVRTLFASYQSGIQSKANANFSPKTLRRALNQVCSSRRLPIEFLPPR